MKWQGERFKYKTANQNDEDLPFLDESEFEEIFEPIPPEIQNQTLRLKRVAPGYCGEENKKIINLLSNRKLKPETLAKLDIEKIHPLYIKS